MKLAWITDTHLNFIELDARKAFYKVISTTGADAVLISGDIAEARNIADILLEIAVSLNVQIYFVLGNHDYYRSSVSKTRKEISTLCQEHALLHWLPTSQIVQLNKDTILVGDDCWADARYGDYPNSNVVLNDSHMIQELREVSLYGKYQLRDVMQKLADADASRLKQHLQLAIEQHSPKQIIVLIHVPPFVENCMHEGKISSDDFLPIFSSKITGDVLLEIAGQNPDINFLALCGHTHSDSYHQPLANLTVKTGCAEYYNPIVQEIIEV